MHGVVDLDKIKCCTIINASYIKNMFGGEKITITEGPLLCFVCGHQKFYTLIPNPTSVKDSSVYGDVAFYVKVILSIKNVINSFKSSLA